MKAAQISEYGSAEVIQIVNIDKPMPGGGQALVEVHAASVNPFDTTVREGRASKMVPGFPITLGGDIAGVVTYHRHRDHFLSRIRIAKPEPLLSGGLRSRETVPLGDAYVRFMDHWFDSELDQLSPDGRQRSVRAYPLTQGYMFFSDLYLCEDGRVRLSVQTDVGLHNPHYALVAPPPAPELTTNRFDLSAFQFNVRSRKDFLERAHTSYQARCK